MLIVTALNTMPQLYDNVLYLPDAVIVLNQLS